MMYIKRKKEIPPKRKLVTMAAFQVVKSSKADGTWFQGCILVSFPKLVSIFGYPDVDGEWTIEFTDGTIVTIYGSEPHLAKEEITNWHIGGFSKDAVKRVNDVIRKGDINA
jgi:hypothetical protein